MIPLDLDFWVDKAEEQAQTLRIIFSWLLVGLFIFTILAMLIQVFKGLLQGEMLSTEELVATLGTVLLLTLVADGFNITKREMSDVRTLKVVMRMTIVGVVGNIIYNSRSLGNLGILDFLPGFAAFAVILGVATASYMVLVRTID